MLTLPAALITEKNKLSNSDPWIVLAKVDLPDVPTTVRVARNDENVSWDGETWSAYPFELDDMAEARKGEIPSVVLRLGNVNNVMNAFLEQANGAVGASVVIYVVHAGNLGETTPALQLNFSINGSSADSKFVTFQLGAQNPLLRRFPSGRFMKNHCHWIFNGTDARCGYSNAEVIDEAVTGITDQGSDIWRFSMSGVDLSAVVARTSTTPGDYVVITGASNAGNNGAFEITTVNDGSDYIDAENDAGVAEGAGSTLNIGKLCDKTLTRCRQLRNSDRYGGFPGTGRAGLKLGS